MQREHYNHVVVDDICQVYNKNAETKVIVIYYWRVNMCIECENKARKNGHIK